MSSTKVLASVNVRYDPSPVLDPERDVGDVTITYRPEVQWGEVVVSYRPPTATEVLWGEVLTPLPEVLWGEILTPVERYWGEVTVSYRPVGPQEVLWGEIRIDTTPVRRTIATFSGPFDGPTPTAVRNNFATFILIPDEPIRNEIATFAIQRPFATFHINPRRNFATFFIEGQPSVLHTCNVPQNPYIASVRLHLQDVENSPAVKLIIYVQFHEGRHEGTLTLNGEEDPIWQERITALDTRTKIISQNGVFHLRTLHHTSYFTVPAYYTVLPRKDINLSVEFDPLRSN